MAPLRSRSLIWSLFVVGIFLVLLFTTQVPVSAGIIPSATPTPNILPPNPNLPVDKNTRVASMQYFTDKGVRLDGPQPQGTSQLVLDTWSNLPNCAPSPMTDRITLGTAWNAADPGGGSGFLEVDSITVWAAPQVSIKYTNVVVDIIFFYGWNGGTADPVFSHAIVMPAASVGPQDYKAGNYYGFTINFTNPAVFPSLSNLGMSVYFGGDPGTGVYEYSNNITPLICFGDTGSNPPIAVGSVPNLAGAPFSFGWYQDYSSHDNQNFNASDALWFTDPSKQNSALQVKIMGHRNDYSVTSAAIQLNGSSGPISIPYGDPLFGDGIISVAGNGQVTYHWQAKYTGDSTWDVNYKNMVTDVSNGIQDPHPTWDFTGIMVGAWDFWLVPTSPNSVTSNIVHVIVYPTISAPTTVTGPSLVDINTSHTYSTGGSVCPAINGTAVEYQFDWGDGSHTVWSSSTSASHSWSSPKNYGVNARARCTYAPDNLSYWSTAVNVTAVATASFLTSSTADGWVLESAAHSSTGGTLNSTSPVLFAGDDALNRQYRSILSFNTSSLPDNASFSSITLKVKQQPFMTLIYPSLAGGNPFALGNLVADIHKGYFGSTAGLEIGDFQAAADLSSAGTFGSTPVSDWYTASIGSSAFTFVNLIGTTQFRVHFTTDSNNNNAVDNLQLYSGNVTATANRPVLIVKYYVP